MFHVLTGMSIESEIPSTGYLSIYPPTPIIFLTIYSYRRLDVKRAPMTSRVANLYLSSIAADTTSSETDPGFWAQRFENLGLGDWRFRLLDGEGWREAEEGLG